MTRRFFFLFALSLTCVVSGCSDGPPADQAPAAVSKAQEEPTRLELENRAGGLMGQFKYDEAVAVLEKLVAAEPGSGLQRVNLAIALLNRRTGDDLARSAELLDAALEEPDAKLRAAYCRALLYFHEGKFRQAGELFAEVARADPADSYAEYYQGQCFLNQGDFAAAEARFAKAQALDPYLRSAYYGRFQAAQRLKQGEQARESLAAFQRLEKNPRARLAELKYTRMGPKAEVVMPAGEPSEPPAKPAGSVFAEAAPLSLQEEFYWDSANSATVADIDGDGQRDLYFTACRRSDAEEAATLVVFKRGDAYELAADHPLSGITGVNTALWGDVNDDGFTDVYLCRDGENQLWQQSEEAQWSNITEATKTGGRATNSVDGAIYDVDHDGDLDILLANADGDGQLLNNDRNSTFTSLGKKTGLGPAASNASQVLLTDLDADDDADLVFVRQDAENLVFMNDRLWEYQAAQGFEEFNAAPIRAVVAADSNVDGQVELFAVEGGGDAAVLSVWQPDEQGKWGRKELAKLEPSSRKSELAVLDFDGDTQAEILLLHGGELQLRALQGELVEKLDRGQVTSFTLLSSRKGPEVLATVEGERPLVWRAGTGRYEFAEVETRGRTDKAAEMRSNASGIGVKGYARIGDLWAALPDHQRSSVPGQSDQPTSIGLAGRMRIDFVRLLWPDGVSQTELDLAPDKLHTLVETQRQAGSCPLVFVWNGQQYEFVADLLGAGGIGFNLGRGEYYDPRPHENLLLPAGLLKPRDERLVIKLGEPMEEICYFDAVRLVAYDLPPGWRMTLDERFGATEPLPTGKPLFYQKLVKPVAAVNDRGEDVLGAVTTANRQAAPLRRADRRFIGLTAEHSVTLEFAQPLDELAQPVLLFDGWVEYAYSQSAFAAWQAGVEFLEPTIEARGKDGKWTDVRPRFGYMAGTPRESTVDLPKDLLPEGTEALRITTNMEIYWDRFAVIDAGETPEVRRQSCELLTALVDDVGFSARTLGPQRCPTYDYSRRPPLGDAWHPSGFYTQWGEALPLVREQDDAVAIIGPGEEVHCEFAQPQDAAPNGWTRYYVLEADGWCKDADLFTKDADTIRPLPRSRKLSDAESAVRETLHREYNTRYRSGR